MTKLHYTNIFEAITDDPEEAKQMKTEANLKLLERQLLEDLDKILNNNSQTLEQFCQENNINLTMRIEDDL